ncbi:MAG: universal stress protein [Proteobacteria bacterium]|nr:universal stress protein [Pseudomonadota bacterium]
MPVKTRVFVVLDPTCMEQAALEWGEQVVREFSLRPDREVVLHIYCCINPDSVAVVQSNNAAHAQAVTEKRVRGWVDRLASLPRAEGMDVITEVEWHDDWRKAIVVAVERAESTIVVKNMTQHSRFVRAVRETSDWTLIRNCPCPMLLVKTGNPTRIKKVLVAVKHSPGDDIYEKANDDILAAARSITTDLGATLHVVTAYTGGHPDRQRFADRCGLERSQVSAAIGAPEKVIAEAAARQESDLLIIARVAHADSPKSLGSTARKVLDEINTEVLILPVVSR